MTVHALVPQCAEPRERYYELFKMQNSQNFSGALPLDLSWESLKCPSAAQRFFSSLGSLKNRHFKKFLDTVLFQL